MKRAILWLCWGEQLIREAAESARSAAAIDADRYLITDLAGSASANGHAGFTSIIVTQFFHGNNLEKSRLIDLLPEGYDTFLYLDADTRIIGDISLGFDKAEQHGIAMAPAPNYNLGEFFDFARVMKQLGHEPADQMMYNAGVIFFKLTEAVRLVLERWRDLCAAAGIELDFAHDQPFLTLALEQLGFTPYVLSPLYNYRSMGEYAVGNIRLWHSHFPQPPGLNDFETAWPARRFKDGKLLQASADAADAALPAPQGMMRLSLWRLTRGLSAEALRTLAAETLAMQRGQGSRLANGFLLERIGMEGSVDNNESYHAEALHYHLGLLHAYAAAPEEMARNLRMSRTMPTADDIQLFSDHVNISRVVRARQLAAVKRGVPPILMACMPRSASATLTYTLARAIDIPVMHLSAGLFPNCFLVPSWLDMFLEGGAITQDHFAASDFNLGVLSGRAPCEVFVLARDPRAAARSQVHFLASRGIDSGEPLQLRIERECIENFIPWLQAWIDCANDKDSPLRVHWITYREVCHDPAAILRKVSGTLGTRHPAIAAFANCQSVEEERMHFVDGNDYAWEADVSPATREVLWNACTPEMKAMFELHP